MSPSDKEIDVYFLDREELNLVIERDTRNYFNAFPPLGDFARTQSNEESDRLELLIEQHVEREANRFARRSSQTVKPCGCRQPGCYC
jgi:hypothetical protein